jgi:hypothetical protein
VRANGRLHALGLTSQVGERLRDRGLAEPEDPQDAPLGLHGSLDDRADGHVFQSGPPQAPELGRRPRQDDGDGSVRLHDEARRRPRDPDHPPAGGNRRLLAHTCFELRVRTPETLGDPPRDRLDLPLELRHGAYLEPRRPREQLDRPVVVRRPQPAREHEQVRLQPLSDRRLQLGRVVADDRDPRRLQTEPGQLLGQEGAVRVATAAADQLAAADDDS